jgi:hypothetical protein
MNLDFTHASYLALIAHIRELGHAVGSFEQILAAPPESYVLLRHDIDFSLERGVEMAELDRQAGVTSTFFILLTSPYFNVLSEQGSASVRAIRAMGHEIGLHIDLTGFELLSPAQQQDKIARLAAVLCNISTCDVRSIAQHRPASTLVRVHSPGFVDAYEDRHYTEIGYISDSRRVFVRPNVYDFFREHRRSQLLIHPLWWTASEQTRSSIFEELGATMSAELQAALRAEDDRIDAKLRAMAQAG